ncbi:Os03g0220700, partial [Oryza sativa Japonica Group]
MAMEICAEAFPLSRFPTLEKSYCADSRDTERSHNTNWITEVHFSNRGSNKLWISEVA